MTVWVLIAELYLIAIALMSITVHLLLLAAEATARAAIALYRIRKGP